MAYRGEQQEKPVPAHRGDGPYREHDMSIRGLIRIANITQLILLAVLATGLIWLARGQHTLNGMVHEFSHLESLLGELGDSVQQTYADALAFVVTGDKASLEAWQHNLQVAQGEAPRPQSSRLAPGQTVSLNALAEGLILPPGVLDQVRALLNETAQLAYLTEATVGRAMGEARAEGRPPDPEGARRMLRSTGLDRLPLELESRMRALRERWRGDFLNEMKARQASLLPLLAAVLAGLSLLAVSAVINIYVCHTRVVRPLRAVNRYAAAVAAGEDPPPCACATRTNWPACSPPYSTCRPPCRPASTRSKPQSSRPATTASRPCRPELRRSPPWSWPSGPPACKMISCAASATKSARPSTPSSA